MIVFGEVSRAASEYQKLGLVHLSVMEHECIGARRIERFGYLDSGESGRSFETRFARFGW